MSKRLNILNVRIGLACNSSSSHSILVLDSDTNIDDVKDGYIDDFGWDFFTAGSAKHKQSYLAKCLEYEISKIIPNKQVDSFLSKFFDIEKIDRNVSVDHQSVLIFPENFHGGINEEFIKDFSEFIERDDVVILGGNDNTTQKHSLATHGKIFDKEYPKEYSPGWIARKDKEKNFWVMFNKLTGSKIRFSLVESINDKELIKGTVPELVDIKITDYCPYDCDFCYQDSTLEGKHADLEFIKFLADKLAQEEVLECCLGGGETTLHPDFLEILNIFKERGIVVNFTTKNMSLLKSMSAKDIFDSIGAIAFSAESTNDIEKVNNAIFDFKNKNENIDIEPHKINIQYVMGSTPINEFVEIVEMAALSRLNITLLGYKENGRGSDFNMHDYSTWLNELKSLNIRLIKNRIYPKISIDTALAAQYKNEFDELGISEKTYHTHEGGFSLYVDAIKKTMAPSSYIGFEQEIDFNENWLENYKHIFIEAPRKKPRKAIKINKDN